MVVPLARVIIIKDELLLAAGWVLQRVTPFDSLRRVILVGGKNITGRGISPGMLIDSSVPLSIRNSKSLWSTDLASSHCSWLRMPMVGATKLVAIFIPDFAVSKGVKKYSEVVHGGSSLLS